MVADGAHLGSLGADDDMTAVAAFPNLDAGLFKHCLGFHVLKQLAVALLVGLLDGGNAPELGGQCSKALFLGLSCHPLIHIRPLGVLAFSGVEQVLGGVAQLAQGLEPELGVFLFVFRGLEEQGGNLLVARLLGNGGKVGVLIPCLRFIDIL